MQLAASGAIGERHRDELDVFRLDIHSDERSHVGARFDAAMFGDDAMAAVDGCDGAYGTGFLARVRTGVGKLYTRVFSRRPMIS